MEVNTEKRPLLFSFAAFLGATFIIWLFLTPITRLVPYYFGETVKYMGTFLVAAGICQERFGGFSPGRGNGSFLKGLFTAGSVGLICAACAFFFSYSAPRQFPGIGVVLGFLCCCLGAAISEEVLFRGLIFSVLRKSFSLKKAILLSAALFGLRHGLNLLFAPGTPVSTLGQVFFTFFAGIYLCAVYVKTGNLRICMTIHFLENFCSGFWTLFSADPLRDGTIAGTALLVSLHLIYVFAAWMLLKQPKAK